MGHLSVYAAVHIGARRGKEPLIRLARHTLRLHVGAHRHPWFSGVVVATLLIIALHVLWLVFRWGPPEARPYLENAFSLVPPFLCFGLIWSSARNLQGRLQLGWRFIALGIGAWALGNVLWAYIELVLRGHAFPSVADAGFLLLPPLFVLGFLRLAKRPPTRSETLRLVLEALIVVASAGVYSWYFLLAPTLEAFAGFSFGLVIALSYPVLDLLLLSLLATFVLRREGWLGGGLNRCVWGLIGLVVADTLFLWQSVVTPLGENSWGDPVWSASFLLFALAAQAAQRGSGLKISTGRGATFTPYLPYIAVVLCFFLVLQVFALEQGQLDPVLIYGTALVTALVVARQIIALQENERLTRRLQGLNHGLEQRVQERTAEL